MSKIINIIQSTITEPNVPSSFINKIYSILKREKNNNDAIDLTKSNLVGTITTSYVYDKYVQFINKEEYFPLLIINPIGYYVYFEDKEVEQILIDNFCSSEGGVVATMIGDPNNGFYKNGVQVFKNNTDITSFNELNQLENITKLGESSFENCTNLTSINLSNIVSLRRYAFKNCSSLAIDLSMPKLSVVYDNQQFAFSGITSVSSIGYLQTISIGMFWHCEQLQTINNDAFANITSIGQSAFQGCTQLSTLGDTSNVTIINDNAFDWCSSLTSFDFTSIITLKQSVFHNCSSLTIQNLSIPNLISMGAYAFDSCNIQRISNLGTLTSIPEYSFWGNKNLKNIDSNVANVMTSIGKCAFQGCEQLTSFDFSNNLTYIGEAAFHTCTSLTITNLSLPNLNTLGGNDVFYKANVLKISDLGNITQIPAYCFCENVGLKTIEYNVFDSITSIGSYAFYNCSSLESVGNTSNITSIGNNAFSNCANLLSFDFTNVTTLGEGAFSNCTNLTTTTTDWSKITYWPNPFQGCSSMFENATLDITHTGVEWPTWRGTKVKRLIIHANNLGTKWDRGYRYPPQENCTYLEYLDVSDTNADAWGPNYNTPKLVTVIFNKDIKYTEYRFCTTSDASYTNAIRHIILLLEDPSELIVNGADETTFSDGAFGNAKIYVKDNTVRDRFLQDSKWGTIANNNAASVIDILENLPVGIWTTGLYKQYEPYLSHPDAPEYQNLPY